MEATGQFDWRRMGKPDYAQACALVASIPAEIRNTWRGEERELLCRITFLCWSFAHRSGRGTAYCVPSQTWLSRTIQRSERSVRRYLHVLRKYGLLSWVCRKKTTTAWATNLYTFGKRFLAVIYAKASKKLQQIQRRTPMADNDLKKEYKAAAHPEQASHLHEILQKARSLGGFGSGEPPPSVAPIQDDEAQRILARKELLRKQAKLLISQGY